MPRETQRSKASTGGSAPARPTSVASSRRKRFVAFKRASSERAEGSGGAAAADAAAAWLLPPTMQRTQRRSASVFCTRWVREKLADGSLLAQPLQW